MANEMRDRLYDLLGECEKKYSAYYEEFIKRLDKAETQADFEKIYDGIIKKHDFFADHLIENGVIVPPCKVGQTVYIIGLDKKIEKYFVEGICLYQDGLFVEILYNGQGFSLPLNKVFLTKAEAEQKLKEATGEEC